MLKTYLIWTSIIAGLSLLPYPFFLMGSTMSLGTLQPEANADNQLSYLFFKFILIFTFIYPGLLMFSLILAWLFYWQQMWAIAAIFTSFAAFCDGLLILIFGYVAIQSFIMFRS